MNDLFRMKIRESITELVNILKQ